MPGLGQRVLFVLVDVTVRQRNPQGEAQGGFAQRRRQRIRRQLDRLGMALSGDFFDDLADQDFVGIDDTEELIAGLAEHGLALRLEQFRVHTASGNCMIQLIREGLGFGLLPMDTIGIFDDLECVLPALFNPEIPVWLVTHQELHTSRRIRLVFDLLAEELETLTEAA